MRKAVHALASEAEWETVSPEHPCPVCGSNRGCSTHSLVFVSCARISSQWPLTTGAWLHRMAPNAPVTALRAVLPSTQAELAGRTTLNAGLSSTRA